MSRPDTSSYPSKFQSSYLNEPSRTQSFQLATVVDVRQLLESTDCTVHRRSKLLEYPHSVSVPACTPPVSVASLATTSVGALALVLRRTIAGARAVPNLISTLNFMKVSMAGVAQASTGVDLWSLSSFVDAPINTISFGVESPAASCWSGILLFLPS